MTTDMGLSASSMSIRWGTGGKGSHSILGFSEQLTDNVEDIEQVFESLSKVEQYYTKYHGIVEKSGPRHRSSIHPLCAWRDQSPKHKVWMQEVRGVTSEQCYSAIERAHRQCGNVEYAKLQIAQNAKMMLTGFLGHRNSISEDKMTCSEFVFDKLPLEMQREAGSAKRFLLDWISPSGGPFGLWEIIELLNSARSRPGDDN